VSIAALRAVASRVLGPFAPTPMTTDDRGRSVEVVGGNEYPIVHREQDHAPPETAREDRAPETTPKERAAREHRQRLLNRWLIVLIVVFFLVQGVRGAWRWSGGISGAMGWPRWAGLAALLTGVAVGLWLVRRAEWFGREAWFARLPLLRRVLHGRCGACGHDLAGIAPGKDGCTVCAECGAAWNLAEWFEDFPGAVPPAEGDSYLQADRPSEAAVSGGRCGMCGYELAGFFPGGHGYTVCAKCGAPWNLAEVHEDESQFAATAESTPARRSDQILIIDARGTHRPLCVHAAPAEVDAHVRERTREFMGTAWRALIAAIVGVPVMIVVVSHAVFAPGAVHGAWPWVGVLAFIVGIGLVVHGVLGRQRARRCALRAITDELVSRGVCPVCGAPLAERPARFDGARPCHDCGAAWRFTPA